MSFSSGYLAEHPVPPGISGALSLGGYELLVDVGGVGAGRLGSQAFLIAAGDPVPGAGTDPGTQVALHQPRLRDEREAAAFVSLAAQLGLLRMSGYRLVLERAGLRSRLSLMDPATGAIALRVPEKHPGRLFGGGGGGGSSAVGLLAAARALPAAGPPPDTSRPELVRDVLLALALRDDSLGGAEAAELADRALPLATGPDGLDPPAALDAARRR